MTEILPMMPRMRAIKEKLAGKSESEIIAMLFMHANQLERELVNVSGMARAEKCAATIENNGLMLGLLVSEFVQIFKDTGATNYLIMDFIDPTDGVEYSLTFQKKLGMTPTEKLKVMSKAIQETLDWFLENPNESLDAYAIRYTLEQAILNAGGESR